tara:strand:- start:16 stop:483 length:468 start_codon:yes stop_codon:yes gene_type:complete
MDLIDSKLSMLFNNKTTSTLLTLILLGYASLVRHDIPNFVVKLFDNPIFRILVLSLIIYKGNKDPKLAIMVAVGFTVTMNVITRKKLFENFATSDNLNKSDMHPDGEDGSDPDISDPDAQPDSQPDSQPDTDPNADPDTQPDSDVPDTQPTQYVM